MLCFPVAWGKLKAIWRGQSTTTQSVPAPAAPQEESSLETQPQPIPKPNEHDPLLAPPPPVTNVSRASSETVASGEHSNNGAINSPKSPGSQSHTGDALAVSIPKGGRGERSNVTVRTDVSPSSQLRFGPPKPVKDDASIEVADQNVDQDLSGVGDHLGQQNTSAPNDQITLQPQNVEQTKLEDELWNARIEWPILGHRYFIPADDIQKLINSKSIDMELRRCRVAIPLSEFRVVTTKILEKAPRLFAILVCQSMGNAILGFLEEGLDDTDLPFIRAEMNPGSTAFKLRSSRRPDVPILCMGDWGRASIELFSTNQWWMQAPIFNESTKVRHYILEDNCVLPYIEDHERQDVNEGGFSTVWAVVVHPAHQFIYKSTNSPNPMIALKRLHSKLKEKFDTEVEMLKHFTNKHHHPHLVKLLATYSYQGRFYLMFPKASANLREYWKQTPTPEFSSETVEWMLQQCKGIASGLAAIHNYQVSFDKENPSEEPAKKTGYLGEDLPITSEGSKTFKKKDLYGRHGDIKPENILISDEDVVDELGHPNKLGILLIADFGLMEFHSYPTQSKANAESVGGSPTYEPPDIILRLPTSRAYDIWSLGCVYLEFITWLVASNIELERFPSVRGHTGYNNPINDDTFFTIIPEDGENPKHAIVRESVSEWILDLHEKPRCSQFVHDFVNLIAKQMLVIDPLKRIHCGPLNEKLKAMCLRAKDDPNYLLKPCPTPSRARSNVAKRMSLIGRQLDGKEESPPPNPTAEEGSALPKREVLHNLDNTVVMSPPLKPLKPTRSFTPPVMRSLSRPQSIVYQRTMSPPPMPVERPRSPSVRITHHPD